MVDHTTVIGDSSPQWSPVFATGVTAHGDGEGGAAARAAMEPGLRDRGHMVTGLAAGLSVV